MMKKILTLSVLCALLLSACSQAPQQDATEPTASPTVQQTAAPTADAEATPAADATNPPADTEEELTEEIVNYRDNYNAAYETISSKITTYEEMASTDPMGATIEILAYFETSEAQDAVAKMEEAVAEMKNEAATDADKAEAESAETTFSFMKQLADAAPKYDSMEDSEKMEIAYIAMAMAMAKSN